MRGRRLLRVPDGVPLHVAALAEPLAVAVLFLCREAAAFTTGSVLAVGGGHLAQ